MYTCVCVGAHPCVHVGVRGHIVDVALVAPGTFLLGSESLIGLDVSKAVRPAVQKTLGIHSPLPSQSHGYRTEIFSPGFWG